MTEFKESIIQTEKDFQNTTEIENNIEDFQMFKNDKTIKEENEIQTLEAIEDENLDDNLDDNLVQLFLCRYARAWLFKI